VQSKNEKKNLTQNKVKNAIVTKVINVSVSENLCTAFEEKIPDHFMLTDLGMYFF